MNLVSYNVKKARLFETKPVAGQDRLAIPLVVIPSCIHSGTQYFCQLEKFIEFVQIFSI